MLICVLAAGIGAGLLGVAYRRALEALAKARQTREELLRPETEPLLRQFDSSLSSLTRAIESEDLSRTRSELREVGQAEGETMSHDEECSGRSLLARERTLGRREREWKFSKPTRRQ